ncbi:MAG: hypothetical protein PHG18_05025 [Bacilli bacterium]|nr:hypothetical protein [Bacilli bacterium]
MKLQDNEKGFLIIKKGSSVKLVPKNIDALEIVTICNDMSTMLCKEVKMSKFKILRLFIKSLFNNSREVNKHNF